MKNGDLVYESPHSPEAAIDELSPHGFEAVCCFWIKRNSVRVQKELSAATAVVGNSYYDPISRSMHLSAHLVATALFWNPQVERLRMIGTDEEIEEMRAGLVRHGIELEYNDVASGRRSTVFRRVNHDRFNRIHYHIPKPKPPSSFPRRRPTVLHLHGDNLTTLHAELLAQILRFGVHRGGKKPRHEWTNVIVEWHQPFWLGDAYEPLEEGLRQYALGVTSDPDAQYTYNTRYDANHNQRFDPERRRNWYPIWIPTDEHLADPPCMVGVFIFQRVITAPFRAHNYLKAWPKNAYLVKHFGENKGSGKINSVVLLSLQGGLKLSDFDAAREFVANYLPIRKPDISSAAGSWAVKTDGAQIVAQLMVAGTIAAEYRGPSSHDVRNKIFADRAEPEDSSEAMWLGDSLRDAESVIAERRRSESQR